MSKDKIIMPPTMQPTVNSLCVKSGVTIFQTEQGIAKATEKCMGESCKLWSVEHKDCLERLFYLHSINKKVSE